MFNPPAELRRSIAPTEHDPWRGRRLVGEVHDENCWALGGAAGHAGLFGTAQAVGDFARAMLGALKGTDTRLASAETVRTVRDALRRLPTGSRALGWDTMLPTSSCGTKMSPSAFGHTGFTGTTLWIDPERDVYVVFLTNRVNPTRENTAIQQIRPGAARRGDVGAGGDGLRAGPPACSASAAVRRAAEAAGAAAAELPAAVVRPPSPPPPAAAASAALRSSALPAAAGTGLRRQFHADELPLVVVRLAFVNQDRFPVFLLATPTMPPDGLVLYALRFPSGVRPVRSGSGSGSSPAPAPPHRPHASCPCRRLRPPWLFRYSIWNSPSLFGEADL